MEVLQVTIWCDRSVTGNPFGVMEVLLVTIWCDEGALISSLFFMTLRSGHIIFTVYIYSVFLIIYTYNDLP